MSASITLARRRLLLAAPALLLGGCSTVSSMGLVADTWRAATAGPQPDVYPRSRAQVDASRNAQIGVRLADAAPGIMVLKQQQRGRNVWLSANRLRVVTMGDRIVATHGFGPDLAEVAAVMDDPLMRDVDDPSSLDGLTFERYVSIKPGDRRRVPVRSTLSVEGPETIEILETPHQTVRVREDVVVADWHWRARNHFWMSPGAPLAWRSIQHLAPDIPPIRIEILKRPPSA